MFTKRVYMLHNGAYHDGSYFEGKKDMKFVDINGDVATHDRDTYVWWENIGIFLTRSAATKYAKAQHIHLDVHSMTIHEEWMYKDVLKSLVK